MDESDDVGVSLADSVAMLRYRATTIGLFIVAALALVLVFLAVVPPRYTATASILLDPMTTSGLRITGGEFSSSPVDSAKIASVAAVIQSSDFLDRIVTAKQLTDDPEFGGGPRGALSRWLHRLVGRPVDDRPEARLAKAEKVLRKAVTVARDGPTYVIRIDVSSGDAAKARDLAATVADAYVTNRVEARIISPPRLPDAPSFPRPAMLLAGAGALGLLCGLAAAFLLERSANCVATPDQIERNFNLPVLASVAMLTDEQLGGGPKKLTPVDYVVKRPFSQFAESIRTLRFGLRKDPDKICRIVQFASPMPDEGKSTLAACVATSLAMDGLRTILIDCDLRHLPSVRARPEPGVADFVMGMASFEDVLSPSREPFLRIIPPGKVARQPPDLANSARLKFLFEAAAAVADFVIVDSPAMEVAVDAAVIAQVVDATVIVAKWRSSDRALIARTAEQILRANGRISGIVLNAIDWNKATYYGYWNKDYVRKTRGYFAAAEARGRQTQAARDAA